MNQSMPTNMLIVLGLALGLICLVQSEENVIRYMQRKDLPSDECNVTDQTMTCVELPETIPSGVKKVIVSRHVRYFRKGDFKGFGWNNITSLQVSSPTIYEIYNGQFKGLDSVEELSFFFPNFKTFARNIFLDTPKIAKINLLDMGHVYTNTVLQAVGQNNELHNLTEITFNPGKQVHPPRFFLSVKSMKGFLKNNLKLLNMSKCVIVFEPLIITELLVRLNVINISGSDVLDIDDFTESLNNSINKHSPTEPLLNSLDISGVTSPYRYEHNHNLGIGLFSFLMSKIVYIYANNIVHKDNELDKCSDYSAYTVFTKQIYFRKNNLFRINCTFNFKKDNPVEVLDLSENKLSFIHPKLFNNMTNGKTLYLSDNRLFEMQFMHEFETLLTSLYNLINLFLDGNDIAYIPLNFFDKNRKLEVIDLANNKLDTIAFQLGNLDNVKVLNLTNNLIQTLDGFVLSKLSLFVYVHNKSVDVRFEGNPITCACQNVPFIEWLNNYTLTEAGLFHCHYLGYSIPIDVNAVDKSKFLCERALVISLSVSGLVVLVIILTVLAFLLRRSRKRRQRAHDKYDFKHRFANGLTSQKYVCFIAYAGKDEAVVRRILIDPLNEKLGNILESDKQLIATGNDFRPGFPIYEETFYFIKDSCVFIAVASDSFCDSEYCKGEIREAGTQCKQVIIVLFGRVQEDKMQPFLLEVFRRKARAKIVTNDEGHLHVVPDINEIAHSVFELAMKNCE